MAHHQCFKGQPETTMASAGSTAKEPSPLALPPSPLLITDAHTVLSGDEESSFRELQPHTDLNWLAQNSASDEPLVLPSRPVVTGPRWAELWKTESSGSGAEESVASVGGATPVLRDEATRARLLLRRAPS